MDQKKPAAGTITESLRTGLYICSPLLFYVLVNTAAGAFLEWLWTCFTAAGNPAAAGPGTEYALEQVWSCLRMVIPAGLGILCLRRETKKELRWFRDQAYMADAACQEDPHRKKEPGQKTGHESREGTVRYLHRLSAQGSSLPLLIVSTVSLSLCVNVLTSLLIYTEPGARPGSLPGMSGVLLQIVLYGFYMPVVEETLFRGILFSRAFRRCGFMPAVLFSSVLFGIYHASLVQGVYAAVMGAVFALAYTAFRQPVIPFGLHGACNLVVLCLQWTGTYDRLCTPGWAAAFAAISVCGAWTIIRNFRSIKKTGR